MISKDDCLSILVKLEDTGVEVNNYVRKLLISKEIPLEVLRFISKNRGIEVGNFYEMLRRKHNQEKSPLYTNLLKEPSSIEELIITLSCLLTQILLYGRKIENVQSFYKEVRAEEITRVLDTYFDTENATQCLDLLKLIKSDILVLEYINGRRELN